MTISNSLIGVQNAYVVPTAGGNNLFGTEATPPGEPVGGPCINAKPGVMPGTELPQALQHQLFERAVGLGHQGEQDESLREQLAKYLHDHHERTLAR